VRSRNFVIIATIATTLMLVATAATPENAFAFKKNQATTQTSACGNGEIPTNVGCQNTDSQIQGDENSVALIAQQTFPEVVQEELPIDECEECLAPLLDTAGVAIDIAADLGLGVFNTDADAISAICEALLSGEVSIVIFSNILPGPIPQEIAVQIIGCVEALL
jgi:hypothetical protein